ncbi:MAG TPA: phosphate ABC transporter permease PstA [Acidimicrobiales bacterium]|nr:phosphate ABC transporter permease PstA [Acidimicrobiales bacterium]
MSDVTFEPPLALDDEALARAAQRRALIRARSGRSLTRRRVGGRIAVGVCVLAVAVSLAPLVALVLYTVSRGIEALSVAFFTHNPTPAGIPGGGVANAIVGSVVIVGLATVMAVPAGVVTALFLLERRGAIAGGVRFTADVLTGIPSIAIGIFAYTVLVAPLSHFSALAGSFALAVLMLPIVIRASEAAMAAVPVPEREAALALGVRRGRVARSIVLRGAVPGLVTGNLLAVARAVGETAPLLFTTIGTSQLFNLNPTQPTAAIPPLIFADGTSPFPADQTTAWGAALVLLLFVLLLSVVARVVAGFVTRPTR